MNEKIKQLAEEAAKKHGHTIKFSTEITETLDSFAELIVRECAELYNHDDVLAPVGQSAWGEAYQDGWIEGTRIYKETILEHFGVEE